MSILDLFLENADRLSDTNREILKNINPKQIVNDSDISITLFEIKYTYTTVRGNKKKGIKYFLKDGLNPERDCRSDLTMYINKFNKENPSRLLSNVKFLESKAIGYMVL